MCFCLGITDKAGRPISQRVFKNSVSYNDGMLEFVTFKSLLHWILSMSRRLAQAGGPFTFNFKDRDNVTYINIDGEFYYSFRIGNKFCR